MKSKNLKKVVGGIIASIVIVMFTWMAAATDVIPPGQQDGIGILSVSGDNPPTTSFTWTGSGDVVVDVVAHNYQNDPTGTFIISGIPVGSNIIKAYMYVTEWEYSSGEMTSGTFVGNILSAVSPISNDPGGGLDLATYRWDVTSFVTGDGSYSFTTSGLERSFGSALVVVYQHPSEPSREIIINDGAESISSATSTTTFYGVSPGSGKLLLFTEADDPLPHGDSESVTFNGFYVAGPGDIFHANQGTAATLLNIPVTTVSGINTASVYSDGDPWFGWELAILSTEVGEMIEKTIIQGEPEIGIYLPDPTTYVFEIAYSGPEALIIDTVPAEFECTDEILDPSNGVATCEKIGKGKNGANRIEWYADGSGTLNVAIQTVQSPGGGHKDPVTKERVDVYKPTACGLLTINDGAIAYEVDEYGNLVLDVEGNPIVIVGPSNSLTVQAVAGAKPCKPCEALNDYCIDADGTASPGRGLPGAAEVIAGDLLTAWPDLGNNKGDEGIDWFDTDSTCTWTLGDDLHVEGSAYSPPAIRNALHDDGLDPIVLDLDGSLDINPILEPVHVDLETGTSFTICPGVDPRLMYYNANAANFWDDGEDIIYDVNGNGVFD